MDHYTGLPNRFKRDLREGKVLIGCWATLANPNTTEILGLAGFDWLMLDGEHAPNELNTFIVQLMALKDSRSAPVVRPQSNDTVQIKRLLDAGFYNFLIPFVESKEEAARAVAATRYPPEGVRGVSVSMRGNRFGTVADYHLISNQNIAVVIQIESRAGVENIKEICAVDGVDAIFIGPSDLAADLGHFGNPSHPEVQAAMRRVFTCAKAAGVPFGILAPAEADARRYLEMGATMLAVGSDLGLFRAATQTLRDKYAL
ncbi:2-dehydro-3-deoxyglucarate aldolase [Massilia horti]|uniref:2-dehydro-3-deoxyglucarate aldolase n=1 Tax=Massilia horti TaxID=2562153 RepID=UPI001E471B6B|nr:2-dehydro-3-deoxyglucarate aldolase [Massilia horti]